MARWSVEQVLAFAPDDSSRKAARSLAVPRTWSDLGSTDSLVWGKCQGSGKIPYQVTVDLNEPAFKCNCPSRKFPCKHGVALLLLWASGSGSVADMATAAPFAQDWAGERAERSSAKVDRAAKRASGATEAPDPAAAAKRSADRDATMTAGLGDFERWLTDLVRQGLAAARRQPYRYWDTAAARLVDAQLPALADRVRNAGGAISGGAVSGGDQWAEALVEEIGRWFVATRGWTVRQSLPGPVAADLRTFLGVTRRREEIEAAGGVADRWHVVGVRLGGDDRLRSQRTWLVGEDSGELVLVLDFAAAGASLQVAAVVGAIVEATVARYPGAGPVRGLFVGERRVVGSAATIPGAGSITDALDRGASWLADNPWLDRVPAALAPVTPVVADGAAWLVGEDGSALRLDETVDAWRLLAFTGGRPVEVFGEIERGRFHATTVAGDQCLVAL